MRKRTVLIVDDQEINRKILSRILSSDYEVLMAKDGVDALKILRENAEISAVLLDIVMPVMDGYEVLRNMHEDLVLSKIPVIVSSQKDDDEDEVKALSLGAYDFIAKPYKADIIRHRLENMIRFRETAAMINKTQKDEMTGVYNKQFFLEKVIDKVSEDQSRMYDLICLGVEKFKLINDTYGEKKGDEVLCCIAEEFQDFCGEEGICGRFSGDEFYGLIPHSEALDSRKLLMLFDKINEFPIPMRIVFHCGVYTFSGKGISTSTICDRAKLAADENRGKYDVAYDQYDDRMRQKLMEEQFIISQMRTAIKERQFEVYYQPKYDLANEKVAGAEALVRWRHPEKGFLSPGSFVPVFEKNGFISQLDRYVWETVCQNMQEWIQRGQHPVSISVNVSRTDIYEPNIVSDIIQLVESYDIPKKYFHLEITESAYTENSDQLIEVVHELRKYGFIIEMDDFGSGYSSLNMLADMPVDILKLDMKFAQMESKNESGKGIMSFVISLAKWLNLSVIAEGVETGEQISDLRQMDCNYVQGFYFAKPMPREQFEELLRGSDITEMLSRASMDELEVVEEKPAPHTRNRQILIVDDVELNRALLSAAFFEEYTIVEKENGKLAWEYLQKNYGKIDVVLLDLLMPVMDGFQLLKKIRTDKNMKSLPVVITSQGNEDSEQRALRLGANDFIAKPYKMELIKHRVGNVVDSHKYRCQHE